MKQPFHVAFIFLFFLLLCNFFLLSMLHPISSSLTHGGRSLVICSIWVSIHDGDMITLNEFLYLYRLKPSTHYGYFELLPWNRESKIVYNFLTSFRDQKSQYLFISGSGWETMSNDLWGEVPQLLQKWEIPSLGTSLFLFIKLAILTLLFSEFFFFFQFLFVPCQRNVIKDELKLPLNFPSQLTTLTSWLILVAYTSVALDLSLLRTF